MPTVSLPRDQRWRLASLLRRAGSREIGGVLMGEQLAPGQFRIVDFSVDLKSGTAAHFVRSIDHHREALDAFYERTGADLERFNYLGEWHSHPCFPVRPSPEDLASMTALVNSEREIDFAALLIVRLRLFTFLDAACFMFAKPDYAVQAGLTT